MPRLVTAQDICKATEQVMREQLPRAVLAVDLGAQLGEVKEWHHVPRLRAISAAQFPAGAITSPGWVGAPRRKGGGSYDATWGLGVGILDRGRDHDEVAERTRIWAGLIRAVLDANPSLGGIGHSLLLKTEAYDQYFDRPTSKTLGGCAVGVEITVEDIVDFSDVDLTGPIGPPFIQDPHPVESVHPLIIPLEES